MQSDDPRRLLMTIAESAKQQSISIRHHWNLIASGRFGPALIRLGRSVRIRANELDQWLDAGAPSKEVWAAMRDGGRRHV